MVPKRLQVQWAVLRTFGAWGRVIAETPFQEPVIALGTDRLVLRQADHQFWAAVTCPSCAVDTASVDLPAHREVCRRLVAVLRTESERAPTAGTNADVPSQAGRRRDRLQNRSSDRVFGQRQPSRARRRDRLQNRSSARVFGQRQATTAGDLLVLAMAIVAAVVVAAVVLRSPL